ncbi:MAG: type II secretion system protein [Vicinamibacteria bacterium]
MPALIAMLAIMAIALMLAMPSWRYLVQDDKEQELIFRGRQISSAIQRFQRKNGNSFPATFDQLVQGKFLRKDYKDPMTRDGKWRILRPGEGAARPQSPFPSDPGRPTQGPSPSPSPSISVFGGNTGGQTGPIAGVVSLSTEAGFRSVNGNSNYNQWIFSPNVPFVIGTQTTGGPPRGPNQIPAQTILRAPDKDSPHISR